MSSGRATPDVAQDDATQNLNGPDGLVVHATLTLSQKTVSRRSFLSRVAKFALAITGASLIHTLPIDREVPIVEATASDCNAWYNCYIAAPTECSCACGGNLCPSGTSVNNWWTGCCWNGTAWYIIEYQDCCGSNPPGCCSTSGCDCHQPPGHTEQSWCGGGGAFCCTAWALTGGGC